MEQTQPEETLTLAECEFPSFAEGDEVEIDDGSGERRGGRVLRATADSYHVDTEYGPIWCGLHQVFAPSSSETPSAPPPSEETGEAAADKPKRRAKKR